MSQFLRILKYGSLNLFILHYIGLFFLLALVLSPSNLQAATVIESDPRPFAGYQAGITAQTVFISDSVGYTFFVDGVGYGAYRKTTDGGSSWGSAIRFHDYKYVTGVSVWYDQWTPGDDSGTYIHIATGEFIQDDVWYTRFDTSDDSFTTSVSASVNTGQGGNIANGSTGIPITKSTTGVLYMSLASSVDSFVVTCSASCDTQGGWTEAGTNPYTSGTNNDWLLLLPLTDGDILTVFWDSSLDDILTKEYEDGAGTWDISFQTIDSTADDNTAYDNGMAAAIDSSTGDVYLAYLDNAASTGSNDIIETFVYDGFSWSATTSPLGALQSYQGLTGLTLGVDQNTGTIYLAYVLRETTNSSTSSNIYYSISTDSMATWQGMSGPVNDSSDDFYAVRMSSYGEDRLYVTWYNASNVTIGGGDIADLDSGETENLLMGIQDIQTTAFVESSSDNYIGAAFTAVKDSGSGNITSLTFTETNNIDAQNDISNIRIYYEAATTCTYNSSETLFGTTANFSGSETVTVTGTMPVSTSQTCIYFVFDADSGATGIFDIEISDPISDISVSSGYVSQSARVKLQDSSNVRLAAAFETFTVDSSVTSDARRHSGPAPTTVFVDSDIGYTFLVNSNGRCHYTKTTDGGETWSSSSEFLYAAASCSGVAVWYDQWTPDDAGGQYIHVAVFETSADDVWYMRFDTSDDSFTTPVSTNINTSQGGGISAGLNAVGITKSTDDVVYVSMIDNTDSFVLKCSASCDTQGGWTEAGTNPFTNNGNGDWVILMPLSDGDILAIYWQVSTSTMLSREYEDGSDTWAGSWTTIASDVDGNTDYDAAFSSTIDPDSGTIFLAYVDDESNFSGEDGDIKTASYDGSSWTFGDDVLTNSIYPIPQVAISYDAVNDDVLVVYSLISDVTNYLSQSIYYKTASSSLTSWGAQSESTLNTSVNREFSAIRANLLNQSRLYATWLGAVDDTLFGTTFLTIDGFSGTLSVDIVDADGVSVSSPSAAFTAKDFSFSSNTTTGVLGVSSERVRVENTTGTATWTLSIAASNPTDIWVSGSNFYDFNDTTSGGTADGGDADSYAGLLAVDPSGATNGPEGGCTSTGISLGTSTSFSEGTTNSVTLVSAGGGADTDCYWDFTDIDLTQTIPAEQASGTYTLDFTVSVIAS